MTEENPPVEVRLIDALHGKRLPEALEALRDSPGTVVPAEVALLERVEASLQALQKRCCAAGETLQTLLASAGAQAYFDAEELAASGRTYALITLRVRPGDATCAQRLLLDAGFLGTVPEQSPSWEIARRFGTHTLLIRNDDDYLRVVLRWRDPDWRSKLGPLAPTPDDVRRFPAVSALWLAGLVIRPLRVLLRRSGRPRASSSFAPFMGTPQALLDPLLEFAAVSAEDTLLDLGCGDATLLLHAVATRGCRAAGYEIDPQIFARAQANRAASGHADRIELYQADARAVKLTGVTVIFLFLPTDALQELVPVLLESCAPGTRIIAHEQSPLPPTLAPELSRLIVAEDILTVAHRWVC